MSDPEGVSYQFQRFQNCSERYLNCGFPILHVLCALGFLSFRHPFVGHLLVLMSVRMSVNKWLWKTDVWRTDGVREQGA